MLAAMTVGSSFSYILTMKYYNCVRGIQQGVNWTECSIHSAASSNNHSSANKDKLIKWEINIKHSYLPSKTAQIATWFPIGSDPSIRRFALQKVKWRTKSLVNG